MRGLSGKKFIIAGGATGIGAATAERLVSEGASVAIGDVNIDGARETVRRLTEGGAVATALEFDFTDEDSITQLVDGSISALDGIDGLYNVAADLSAETVMGDADILHMDAAIWRRTNDVNLIGYALSCKAVIPHLLEHGGGVIVNTSSGAAHAGEPTRPAYAASKAGVSALTRHIAATWGKQGIRCNAVAPGIVLTEGLLRHDITALRAAAEFALKVPALGQPEDLASVVAFLLSDDSIYVSGQVWSVNGGWTVRE